MKRISLAAILVGLLAFGCNNDDVTVISACDVENPIEDLEWLRSEIQRRKNDTSADAVYCYIEQAKSDGQTIFIYNDCNPLASKVIPILNCSGTSVGFLGDENFRLNGIEERFVLFRPTDFACKLD